MIEKLVRKNILKLKPYTSARGSYLEGTLMDANENSLGSVIEDKDNLELNRYPDPSQNRLREKLSALLNVQPENLFFGVGSDEIIDLLIRIFCEPGKDNVLIPQPTYGMYKVACDINNVKVLSIPLNRNFDINVNSTLKAVRKNTKMIFLCSPNNPTGNLLSKNSITKILQKYKGIVVVDEAYIDFSENNSTIGLLKDFNNLVLTRTFSKAWGLAGIRCGFSVANPYITELLFKIKAPYNMNKYTTHAILKALENKRKRDSFVKKLNAEREKLILELSKIKQVKKILPTDANFITFKISNATKVFKSLAEKGVIIRNRSNELNMSDCLRVSIGTPKENKLFIKHLKEVI